MCQEAVRKLCNPSESCHVRKVARLLARPLRETSTLLRRSTPQITSATNSRGQRTYAVWRPSRRSNPNPEAQKGGILDAQALPYRYLDLLFGNALDYGLWVGQRYTEY